MKLIYAVFILIIGICFGASANPHKEHDSNTIDDSKSLLTSTSISTPGAPTKASSPQSSSSSTSSAATTTTASSTHTTIPTSSPTSSTQNPPSSTQNPPSSTRNPPTSPTSPSNTPHPTTTSTTPSPPPRPEYGIGSWNVTDGKNHVCILLKGEIELNLVNETDKKVIESYQIPKNTLYHGDCLKEFIEFELPSIASFVRLTFGKDNSNSTFYLKAINASLTYKVENQTKYELFKNGSLQLFGTPVDQSYYCAPESENQVAQNKSTYLTLKVKDFQFQAFKNSSSSDFDKAVNCEIPHTKDLVPIIVGCLLGLLVVLVLVAYLISRRRFQARGYHSM